MDGTYHTPRADKHHPPSLELEATGEAEEREAMFDLEKNSKTWIEDHQHNLGGGEEGSLRPRKVEASSQGPPYLQEGTTRNEK